MQGHQKLVVPVYVKRMLSLSIDNKRSSEERLLSMVCHAKIGPPRIGPAGPILAENVAKIGPPCQFWSPCQI